MAPPSSSPSSADDAELVKPCPNDVLLGRGSGRYHFSGNQKWRKIIAEKKEEYYSAKQNKIKNKIAREVFERVRSNGGRFLKLARVPVDDAVQEKVWSVAHVTVSLEKCKQALREQLPEPVAKEESQEQGMKGVGRPRNVKDNHLQASLGPYEYSASFGVGSVPGAAVNIPSVSFPLQQTNHLTSVLPPLLLNNVAAGALGSPVFVPFVPQPYWPAVANASLTNVGALHVNGSSSPDQISQRLTNKHALNNGVEPQVLGGAHDSQQRKAKEASPISGSKKTEKPSGGTAAASMESYTTPGSQVSKVSDAEANRMEIDQPRSERSFRASSSSMEEDASDFLTFCLQASDKPRFTEEEEKKENAALTDEERADVLVDMFGKYCNVDSPKSKRARRDLDPVSIKFLVDQMKAELWNIPEAQKRAMMEAQRKCDGDEFSDARLEQFLRCEGMNSKMGAKRFVNYWESRRQVFGPEKYLMRMTLSEALRDDLVALEKCVCNFLPHMDDSGRQLLFWESRRHTREGYTSESMLRAMWYVVEVMAKENSSIDRAIVLIKWDKHMKFCNYDSLLDDSVASFLAKVYPVRLAVAHVCLTSRLLIPVLKPIVWAFMDKAVRSRMNLHEASENEILGLLSTFGIHRDMLPTEAGGTVRLNQSEWIAYRRAAEMEEI